jgi:hypothetical protein
MVRLSSSQRFDKGLDGRRTRLRVKRCASARSASGTLICGRNSRPRTRSASEACCRERERKAGTWMATEYPLPKGRLGGGAGRNLSGFDRGCFLITRIVLHKRPVPCTSIQECDVHGVRAAWMARWMRFGSSSYLRKLFPSNSAAASWFARYLICNFWKGPGSSRRKDGPVRLFSHTHHQIFAFQTIGRFGGFLGEGRLCIPQQRKPQAL